MLSEQARVLAGLPLGSTRQHEPAVMVNLLGDIWFESADAVNAAELEQLSCLESVERRGEHYRLRIDRSLGSLATVLQELERQRVTPVGLSAQQATLDDVFLQLTGRALATENGKTAVAEPGS